jgi:hypothetical protein
MKTGSSDTVYCPGCFRVVEDRRVFCFFCGQFIHSHVPTDSRLWDSRLSDLTVLAPPPPEEQPTIEIPDDLLNAQNDPSSENTVRANDHSNPVYTTKDFESPHKSALEDPASAAATPFTETSADDPVVSEKSDIERDEESQQDHQATI